MRVFLSFLQFCIPLAFALLALDPAVKAIGAFDRAITSNQMLKQEMAATTRLMSQGYGWPPAHYDNRWMYH